MSKRLVLFASGSGSNVENIIHYFQNKHIPHEYLVFCNNPKAGVIERCHRLSAPIILFHKSDFEHPNGLVAQKLKNFNPDLVVLAGFLWLYPTHLLQICPKTINIHPALLPRYGGKGMYGMNVHKAVFDAKDKETGITIHWVNEHYDEGAIVFQATAQVADCNSPEEIAQRVHALEYQHFPKIIEQLLKDCEK